MKYKIFMINENTYKIITDKSSYTFSINRISLSAWKSYVKSQKDFLDYSYENNHITLDQYNLVKEALLNGSLHNSHSILKVLKENLLNKEIEEYIFPITKSENKIVIIPSSSHIILGEIMQYSNVIKIAEGLYIPSHGLVSKIDLTINKQLEPYSLQYDKVKNCHVDIDKYNNSKTTNFINLTKENVEKMCIDVVDLVESTTIKKFDITSSVDIKNDIVSYKVLEAFKNGVFNNKSINEQVQVQQIDTINDNCLYTEKEYNKFINQIKGKPEDEL